MEPSGCQCSSSQSKRHGALAVGESELAGCLWLLWGSQHASGTCCHQLSPRDELRQHVIGASLCLPAGAGVADAGAPAGDCGEPMQPHRFQGQNWDVSLKTAGNVGMNPGFGPLKGNHQLDGSRGHSISHSLHLSHRIFLARS